jgi:hypothetical protein
MSSHSRREFLADVGKGMFLTTLGAGLAADLGLGAAWAADEPGSLTFGDLEPLVSFMHETPPGKLLPAVVEKLRTGTDLKQLVAAAALANARAFGGEDYTGYHTLMALGPSYRMALEEKDEKRRPLAVLKVLYRNSSRLQEKGGRKAEVLRPVEPREVSKSRSGEQLREIIRQKDLAEAEGAFAVLCRSAEDGLNALMFAVDDATDVHRVVLVSRSWDLLDFVGKERAHTLLRQSVHYCVQAERYPNQVKRNQPARDLLPKLLDQHGLLGRSDGTRTADDAWVSHLADTIFRGTPAQAAEAAAAALAEGFTPDAVGEAIALAANQLVLRDEGRPANQTAPNKPVGSIHGDSIGVHACDSANAWRNIARVGDHRTRVTSLILGAYQVAQDRVERGGDFLKWEPYPRAEHREKVAAVPAQSLLKELDGAIREKDQARAAALVARLGQEGHASVDVFGLLRKYGVSEDGALHAEKFYRTTTEEFASARPAFRWRQLVALSRVTASEYGTPAPGYTEACELMRV